MTSTLFTEIYTNVWGYKDDGYEDGGSLIGNHPIQSGGNVYGYIGAIFVPEKDASLSSNINTDAPYNVGIAAGKIVIHLCVNDGHPYLNLTEIKISSSEAGVTPVTITSITEVVTNDASVFNMLKSTSGQAGAVIKQPKYSNPTRNTNNYVFIADIPTSTWPYTAGATNAGSASVSLSFNPGHKLQVAGSSYISRNVDVADTITTRYITASKEAEISGTFKVNNSSANQIFLADANGVSVNSKLAVSALSGTQIAEVGSLKIDNYTDGGVSGVDLFVARAGSYGYDSTNFNKYAIRISQTNNANQAANSVSIGRPLTVVDSASFTKASGTGLAVTSGATVGGSIVVGTTNTLTLVGDGTSTRITSSDGTVNFGDDHILTTGNVTGDKVYGDVDGTSLDLGAQIKTLNDSIGGSGSIGTRVTANEKFRQEFDNREHGWDLAKARYRFPGEDLTSTNYTIVGNFPDKDLVWKTSASSNGTDSWHVGVASDSTWESGTSNYGTSGVGQTFWNGTSYKGEALTYEVPLVKENGLLVNKMCISYKDGTVTANKHAKKFVLIGHDDNNSKAVDSDGRHGPTSGVRMVLLDGTGTEQLPEGHDDAYDTIITYDITYPRPFKYLTLVVTETGGATSVEIAQLFFYYQPQGYGLKTTTNSSGTATSLVLSDSLTIADSSTIGCASDTDILTLANQSLTIAASTTVAGTFTVTGVNTASGVKIGDSNNTCGQEGVSVGREAKASNYSVALGWEAAADGAGDHNISIGRGANSATRGTALGHYTKAQTQSSVALGYGSKTNPSVPGQIAFGPTEQGGSGDIDDNVNGESDDQFVFGACLTSGGAASTNASDCHNIVTFSKTGTIKAADNLILDKDTSSGATATIGTATDPNLITLANGLVTVAGEISVTTLDIGGTNVTSNATELNVVNGSTAATSTTLVDVDRVVVNDGGTMKQVALSDFTTYLQQTETTITSLPNLATVGTIGTGVWQGTAVADAYVGTLSSANKVSGSAVQLAGTSAIENSTGLHLKTELAGTGLTLTSQVLSVDASQAQITTLAGATTIGTADTPTTHAGNIVANQAIEITGTATLKSTLIFEGASTNKITLNPANPSSDVTIVVPDTAGTMCVEAGTGLSLNATTGSMSVNASLTSVTSIGTSGTATVFKGPITAEEGITVDDGELKLAGTAVNATATELNIVDGDTAATSITLVDADRVVVNDGGTMVQVALTNFETYFETALDTLPNVTTVGTSGSTTTHAGPIAASEGVEVTGNVSLGGSLIFEGATADAHETTLTVTDPTEDRTITLPNVTGTVQVSPVNYTWPASDGTDSYFLQTNGNGTLDWSVVDFTQVLDLAGTRTMTGAIAMGTKKITGMGNPTANQDAATKAYVDSEVTASNFTGNLTQSALIIDSGDTSGATGTIGTGSDDDLMTLADNSLSVAGKTGSEYFVSSQYRIDGTTPKNNAILISSTVDSSNTQTVFSHESNNENALVLTNGGLSGTGNLYQNCMMGYIKGLDTGTATITANTLIGYQVDYGSGAEARPAGTCSFGAYSKVGREKGIAIGYYASCQGQYSISIGVNAECHGYKSLLIAPGSQSTADNHGDYCNVIGEGSSSGFSSDVGNHFDYCNIFGFKSVAGMNYQTIFGTCELTGVWNNNAKGLNTSDAFIFGYKGTNTDPSNIVTFGTDGTIKTKAGLLLDSTDGGTGKIGVGGTEELITLDSVSATLGTVSIAGDVTAVGYNISGTNTTLLANHSDNSTVETYFGNHVDAKNNVFIGNDFNLSGSGRYTENSTIIGYGFDTTYSLQHDISIGFTNAMSPTSGSHNCRVCIGSSNNCHFDKSIVIGHYNTTGASFGKQILIGHYMNNRGKESIQIHPSTTWNHSHGDYSIVLGSQCVSGISTGSDAFSDTVVIGRKSLAGMSHQICLGQVEYTGTIMGQSGASKWVASNTTDAVVFGYAGGSSPSNIVTFGKDGTIKTKAGLLLDSTDGGTGKIGVGGTEELITLDSVSATLGTVSIAGVTSITDTTGSTSIGSGALKVSGGVGIVENIHGGGTLNIAGNTGLGGTLTVSGTNTTTLGGVTSITVDTQSTGTTAGALKVSGGVGIAKNIHGGGTLNIAGVTTLGGNLTVSGTNTTTLGGVTSITVDTQSTGTTAGALKVSGGVGIAKNIHGGGTLNIAGNTGLGGTLDVTGISTLNGNVNISGSNTLTVGTGDVTLGGKLGVVGDASFESNIIFEGASTNKITLNPANPSSDVTIVVPDTAGTMCVEAGTGLSLNATTGSMSVNAQQTHITEVGTLTVGIWQGTQIADTYIATISTADKVSGSAVQLAASSAIENSTGLRLKDTLGGSGLTLSAGQILSVNPEQDTITRIGTQATQVEIQGTLKISGTSTSSCYGAFNAASGGTTGAWQCGGQLSGASLSVTSTAGVSGNLTVGGDSTLNNTTVNDTFTVKRDDGNGSTTNSFKVFSNGNTEIYGTLTVTGGVAGSFLANTQSIAIGGDGSNITADVGSTSPNIAIGKGATATSTSYSSIAIGESATCLSFYESVAIGKSATISDDKSVAIGVDALGLGEESTALGHSADAVIKAVSIGSDSKGYGISSVGVGNEANAFTTSSVAVGHTAKAGTSSGIQHHCTAIGSSAKAVNDAKQTSIGYNATSAATGEQVVIGQNKQLSATIGECGDAIVFGYNQTDVGSITTAGQIKATAGLLLDSASTAGSAGIGIGGTPALLTLTSTALTVVGEVASTTIDTTSDATVGGDLTTTGLSNLDGGIAVTTNKFTVATSGDTLIAGTLTANNAVGINSTADVSGTMTCSKASGTGLNVTANASVGGDLTVAGHTTITGDLTVHGSSTQITSTQVTITDPVFVVANNNTTATQPRGIQMEYDKSGGGTNSGHAALLFDASKSKFILANHWINGNTDLSSDFGQEATNEYGNLDIGDIAAKGNIDVVEEGKKVTARQLQIADSNDGSAFVVTVSF